MSADVAIDAGPKPLSEAAKEVGISYRQADFWVTRGYVNTTFESRYGRAVSANPTSGHVRVLSAQEESVLKIMADLVHVGFTAKNAARVARLVLGSHRPVRLGTTLRLSLAAGVDS